MFQAKNFTGLLEFITLYKQNPLDKFFILIINLPKLYYDFNCVHA